MFFFTDVLDRSIKQDNDLGDSDGKPLSDTKRKELTNEFRKKAQATFDVCEEVLLILLPSTGRAAMEVCHSVFFCF